MKFSKKIVLNSLLIATFFVVLQSCEDDKNTAPIQTTDNFDRAKMLTNLTDNYILPAYKEYSNQTAKLKTSVTEFNASPSIAKLAELRVQWKTTLLTWQDVSFLNFGPAANIVLELQTNVYPTDTSLINANIASGSYDLKVSTNYKAKGYQALDYLINGIKSTDAEIVNYFTANSNSTTYLLDIANELDANATTINDTWNNSFASEFKARSADNNQGSSVSNILNGMIQHYEFYIRRGKVGIPSGAFNTFTGVARPQDVEAFYYKKSLPFASRAVDAIGKFFNGINYTTNTNGLGFDDYLEVLKAQTNNSGLNGLIQNQITSIQTSISGLNDPLSNEVIVNKEKVRATYTQMQQLVPYLKVETTKALGVLITYADTDGD